MRSVAAALVLLVCLAAAGCGLGAGSTPKAVQVLVTRDFGARALKLVQNPKIHGQDTVMSLLLRNFSVGTRYGGRFVESIGGLSGGAEGSRPVDWFYYVNGVEAHEGAASTDVHPGDHIWWDLHDWSQTEDIPAVVGTFPEPFLHGLGGKRLPVRVECTEAQRPACGTVVAELRRSGVPAALSAPAPNGGEHTLRVLVGPWSALRGDLAAAALERGPRASGVYALPARDGRSFALLDRDGARARTLAGEAGLIAATRRGEEEAPVWVVTGTSPRGVELAAGAFTPAVLRDRFAVAVSPAGPLALPLGGG